MEKARKRQNCLVIEDEALAIEQMEDYIGRRDDLSLIGVATQLSEIRGLLAQQTPDIIFLDLVIPPDVPDGFHYGEFPRQSSIIVVSGIPLSYYRGALPEGELFELFKPVSFGTFEQCVDEVLAMRRKQQHGFRY